MEVKNAILSRYATFEVLGDDTIDIFELELRLEGGGILKCRILKLVGAVHKIENIFTGGKITVSEGEFIRVELDEEDNVLRIGHILEDKWYPEREK